MISSKYIGRIAVLVTVLALAACFAAIAFKDRLSDTAGGDTVKLEYEEKLFDTSQIISVNIIMDSDEWDEMLENALKEEYYACDVEVNGTRFYNVAIRPKGNTSLSSIANDPDTNRYSFKLEFGHFVEGQTCFGLDKLILNNNYADATNMKEAVAYDMFKYLGADASLYNYADISVNGEYWGIYLALEAVEDSFLMRNYGAQDGELYKPDPMNMNNNDSESGGFGGNKGGGMPDFKNMPKGERPDFGNMPDFENMPDGMPDFGNMPDFENMPDGMPDFDNMPGGEMPDLEKVSNADTADKKEEDGENNSEETSDNSPEKGGRPDFKNGNGGGGFPGMGGSGANLNYTDDDLDSYSSIWESSIYPSGTSEHKRVVTALKNISEGTDLEKYMDIDNLLKYMAVHSFLVNQDSLSGNMAHNYYLYESGGKLNIIPWDYNLSLGGMGNMGGGFGKRNTESKDKDSEGTDENTDEESKKTSSGASSMINDPIDTPFDGTDFFDTLLENEEYLAKYHEYYQKLVDEYVNGGAFDETYNRIVSQISDKVKTDPNAFYTYDEFEAAHKMLYKTVKLRAESVKGQLDGTIPSTNDGQTDSDALIDASEIDTSVMGSMHINDKGMGEGNKNHSSSEDGEDSEKGGMRPGGMAPPRSAAQQDADKSENKVMLLACGAVMAAALIFAGLLKRKLRR